MAPSYDTESWDALSIPQPTGEECIYIPAADVAGLLVLAVPRNDAGRDLVDAWWSRLASAAPATCALLQQILSELDGEAA